MAITINGQPHADGEPLTVGGVQVTTVTVNDVEVWQNTVIPSAITDFNATSSGTDAVITYTFTPSVGIPTPTQDLYENDILVASGVVSGGTYTSAVSGTNSYKVKSVNVVDSVDSNAVSANVWIGGTSLIITASGTYTAGVNFPSNVAINICQCGGGGGGIGGGSVDNWGGGGGAGVVGTGTATLSPSEAVVVTIGGGGAGRSDGYSVGDNGGPTSFGGYLASNGGLGGNDGGHYNGNNGVRTTCGGTGADGDTDDDGRGGQSSGFGNGGNGSNDNTGGGGGIGSGGGGSWYNGGGSGGRGQINLSW